MYFPIFAAADARIRHGIDLPNADHEAIDAQVQAMAKAANTLLGAAQHRATHSSMHWTPTATNKSS